MRKLTITLIAIAACLTVFTNVQAQANFRPEPEPECEGILFPFESLGHSNNGSDAAIGDYMTGIYGSNVTVQNAQLKANFILPLPWLGKPHGDYYLKTDDDKSMEIFFERPITNVKGDGYVFFSDKTNSPDFKVVGFDENNIEVNTFSEDTHWFQNVPFDLAFDEPVYKLRIRDNYECFVAVDNLCVTPVPVPGAGILSMLGMGIAGWLKRRNTL
jgi:hypothetical protein